MALVSANATDDKSEDARAPSYWSSYRPFASGLGSSNGSLPDLEAMGESSSSSNPLQESAKRPTKGSAKLSPGGSSNGSAASSRSGSRHRSRRQLIVGMSANIDAATRQRALDSGMDAFLPKVGWVHCVFPSVLQCIGVWQLVIFCRV